MNDAASIIEQFLKDAASGNLKTRHYPKEFQSLQMKVSFGQGGLAKVPWIAFLRDGQQVQNGIYPVYLFYKEFNCLVLAYGVSQNNLPKINWPNVDASKISVFLNERFGVNSDNYTDSFVFSYYDVSQKIDHALLNNDLNRLISFYKELQLDSNDSISSDLMKLPKPFLLLAGISGTGKSRFVREQAKQSSGEEEPSNYALISVRPDWHEPSDLLGYVSRLGEEAPHFVSTPTLKFMVQAWKAIKPSPDELAANRFLDKNVLPYWLCLDEMNLAPVEQYFADYLSVVETREWTDEGYRCAPLLKADVIAGLSDKGKAALKKDLGLEKDFDSLWNYFTEKGIPLPYNLIVAGTVNMDETTHGFSRKVIDRALSIDFGEFFPNEFNSFFNDEPSITPILLGYPTASEAREKTQAAEQSRRFLSALNEKALKGTAFEVAFRALNELLLSVHSFSPYDDSPSKLQAVWDDFLMMKVLPRIEGDRDKVEQVLENLSVILTEQLNDIWSDEAKRPDLWRDTEEMIACRSKVKIKWMQERLNQSGFTSFWP